MLVLLSPAKRMDFAESDRALPSSKPEFLSDAHKLIDRARELSQGDIKKLMNLSDDLAEVNFKRFKGFKKKANALGAKCAVLAFNGDVYLGLEAETLSNDDLGFAQDHLRILSGLYGILKPLDLIQPYRLEMGRELSNERGSDLYAWWGDKIARTVNRSLKTQNHPAVVNLASNEYFSAARADKIKAPIITPVFRDIKDGKARTLSFFAKKARGSMARAIIEDRIDNPESLKALKVDDYTYREEMSSAEKWVFARKQPPPVGK